VSSGWTGGFDPDPREPSEHWPLQWWYEAYAGGWFPMALKPGDSLQLCRSRRRALLPLDESFHIPRSLRRWLSGEHFQLRLNQGFDEVLAGCADRPSTWISPELARIYRRLHAAGLAHSVEAWDQSGLAGGLLAIGIGACWIGESMFHRRSQASKVVLVRLVEALRVGGFELFDVQLSTPHLERFGCVEIADAAYIGRLRQARRRRATLSFGDESLSSEPWMRE
jgi:leucyl/phenylalanyl-tRNA--protein transferase